jgi:predicted GH43/DUF377 family glycosyl hydrolase
MNAIFKRLPANPLITPRQLPFPAAAVPNSGATEQLGEVVLLLRAEGLGGHFNIRVPWSRDGVTGWQVEPHPILEHGLKRWRYESFGCEDARLTHVEEEDGWCIAYTPYSEHGAAVA